MSCRHRDRVDDFSFEIMQGLHEEPETTLDGISETIAGAAYGGSEPADDEFEEPLRPPVDEDEIVPAVRPIL